MISYYTLKKLIRNLVNEEMNHFNTFGHYQIEKGTSKLIAENLKLRTENKLFYLRLNQYAKKITRLDEELTILKQKYKKMRADKYI